MRLVSDEAVRLVTDVSPAADKVVDLAARGAESFIRKETQRQWNARQIVDQPIDSQGHHMLMVGDYPVTAFTSLKRVVTRDANGAPATTETIDRKTFAVDLRNGIITKNSGAFYYGKQLYLITADVGFTDAQLENPLTIADFDQRNDVQTMQLVTLRVIDREYSNLKKHNQHISSFSAAGENVTIQFNLTRMERDLLFGQERGVLI